MIEEASLFLTGVALGFIWGLERGRVIWRSFATFKGALWKLSYLRAMENQIPGANFMSHLTDEERRSLHKEGVGDAPPL